MNIGKVLGDVTSNINNNMFCIFVQNSSHAIQKAYFTLILFLILNFIGCNNIHEKNEPNISDSIAKSMYKLGMVNDKAIDDSPTRKRKRIDSLMSYDELNWQKLKEVNFSVIKMTTYKIHKFSDTSCLDSFVLSLYGISYFDGGFMISVFNSRKKLIYPDIFSLISALDVTEEELIGNEETEKLIDNLMNGFFAEESYHFPAFWYRCPTKYPKYGNRTINDIEKDKTAIGFSYGEGNMEWKIIA